MSFYVIRRSHFYIAGIFVEVHLFFLGPSRIELNVISKRLTGISINLCIPGVIQLNNIPVEICLV